MSSERSASEHLLVADGSRFRSVFAKPDERLILALSSAEGSGELSKFLEVVEKLRQEGVRLKTVVYGAPSAALVGSPAPNAAATAYLETWAEPLLPGVCGVADIVIRLDQGSASDLAGFEPLQGKEPITIEPAASPETLRELLTQEFSVPPSDVRKRTPRSGDPGPKPVTAGAYILQNDWGIGDELLLSAVAREIVAAYPEIRVWIRSRHGFRFPAYVRRDPPPGEARRVETIYQNAVLYGPASHSPFPGHLVQQMLDKFALDTGLRVRAKDVRPELDLVSSPKRAPGTLILHSGTNPRLPTKDWGIERWKALSKILVGSGVEIRQVGSREETLLPGARDFRGTPPGELPELFSSSAAVVSVVGFLMHLAEATRTPAVVIYGGREHPAIDGYPDQVHLSSGPIPCRGRWGCHLAPDHSCPHEMKCMDQLTPELVAAQVLRALGRGSRR